MTLTLVKNRDIRTQKPILGILDRENKEKKRNVDIQNTEQICRFVVRLVQNVASFTDLAHSMSTAPRMHSNLTWIFLSSNTIYGTSIPQGKTRRREQNVNDI